MKEFDRLVEVVAALRGENGCPWDKKQTLYSLKADMKEEMAELLDALDNKDFDNIREELGDVLLHIVFHSVIASEMGLFSINDVANGITDKMIRRHPHVFGDKKVRDAEEVLERWQEIKAEEKAEKGDIEAKSFLDKVPRSLSTLCQAENLQKHAAKVGFDWSDISGVFAKVKEELGELEEAYANKSPAEVQEELGDLLFSIACLASHLKADADEALRLTNLKFRRRFKYIEDHLNKSLEEATLEEMDALWEESKKQEKK